MKFTFLLAAVAVCGAPTGFAHAADGNFDSHGVKIRYVTEGQGEAVVLIHGWLGDSTMWGRDAAGNTKLATLPGFEIIAMDCRGHGKSDKPHDPKKYGVEMGEDVVRLLDHLKIKKAHLIGYSMGSFIAGYVAATHPERVLSVIYGGQSPLIVGAPSTGSNEVEVFAKAVDDGKGLGPYLLNVWPADKPKPTLDQANSIANYLYGGKDTKALALAGLSLDDLAVKEADLAKCQAPALFIYGSKESHHLGERVASLRKVLAHSEVKVIEGTDHVTTVAKPEFAATIVAFLTAHKVK